MTEQGTYEAEKNDMANALIIQSVPEALILQVGDLENAKKVWEAIKARHMGADKVKEARLQTLMAEFERLKMKDNDTIDAFVGKLSEIASKSSALGENIEESKLVKNSCLLSHGKNTSTLLLHLNKSWISRQRDSKTSLVDSKPMKNEYAKTKKMFKTIRAS